MKAYATADEYKAFSGATDALTDFDRLALRASEIIDSVVMMPFDIDATDGLPTGFITVQGNTVTIASIMSDACCAQIEFWQEVGEDNDVDGLAGTDVNVSGYSGKRSPTLAPRAARIIKNAGMIQ